MLQQRHDVLKNWMKENNVDVLMIQSRSNVFYLSGFDSDPHERIIATFLFQDSDPFIICPNMEVNQIKEFFRLGEIIGYSDTEDPWEKIEQACQKQQVNVHKIAIEADISWQQVKRIEKLFSEVKLIEVDEAILSQRLIKTEAEIATLREAAKLADYGVQIGVRTLKEGITEMEVLATIEFELKKKGIREMSFSTMVLFGEKAGDPHGNPGIRKLKKGDAVLFDLGVVSNGYCSDITRTVFFDHIAKKDQEVYETVLTAQKLSLEACHPGNPIAELDKRARNWITKQGFGEYFPHRIGHGLGIEVHEYPSLTATNNDLLYPGMTFTIEPGIYIPNLMGVRIEDDVLITKDGHETLTKFPKELTIVPE